MTNNKHGPPGWINPLNKGAPQAQLPGIWGQDMPVSIGCFNRNGSAVHVWQTPKAGEIVVDSYDGVMPLKFSMDRAMFCLGWHYADRSMDAVRIVEGELSACKVADSERIKVTQVL